MHTISPRTEQTLDAVGLGHLVLPMRMVLLAGATPTVEFAEQLRPLIVAAYTFVGPAPELRALMRICLDAKRYSARSEGSEPGSFEDILQRFHSDDDSYFEGDDYGH